MQLKIIRLHPVLLAILLASCNSSSGSTLNSVDNNPVVRQYVTDPGLSTADLAEFDKEYSVFETKAITERYLKKR